MKNHISKTLILISAIFCVTANAQQIEIDLNFPATCKSNERCTVEVVIDKGDIEGFARFQQNLPDGFTAELINDAGSDFIFDKQRVSFIWLSLPAESPVIVSYRLKVDASLSGTFNIEGAIFSYLLENKIQRHTVPPVQIDVNMKATPPVAKAKPDEVKEIVKPIEMETTQPLEEVPEVAVTVVETADVPKQVVAEIDKPAEVAPVLQEKEKESVVAVVEEPKVVQPEKRPDVQKPDFSKSPEAAKVPDEKIAQEASSGIFYRVQFVALKNFREPESLKKQFNLQEQVYHESADGWQRYTFGQWKSQAEAEAAMKAFISRTGSSAYVVKYQNGKRIQ